jgi:hypothetical protein
MNINKTRADVDAPEISKSVNGCLEGVLRAGCAEGCDESGQTASGGGDLREHGCSISHTSLPLPIRHLLNIHGES